MNIHFQIDISSPISNHFQKLTAQNNQQRRTYMIHGMTLRNKWIENLLILEEIWDAVAVWPRQARTDDDLCFQWWMVKDPSSWMLDMKIHACCHGRILEENSWIKSTSSWVLMLVMSSKWSPGDEGSKGTRGSLEVFDRISQSVKMQEREKREFLWSAAATRVLNGQKKCLYSSV